MKKQEITFTEINTIAYSRKKTFKRILSAVAAFALIAAAGSSAFRNFSTGTVSGCNSAEAFDTAEISEENIQEETEVFEPEALDLDPDDVWTYFDKNTFSYPEGYIFDRVVTQGSRVPYFIMKNSAGEEEIFRVNAEDGSYNMERICSVGEGTYSVSSNGSLYSIYRESEGKIAVENLTDTEEKSYLPDLGENAFYYVIGDNRKICLYYRDGNEPFCVFFDNEGNITNEVRCDLYGEPYNENIKINYSGCIDCPDGREILVFSIVTDTCPFNGYCTIDPGEDDFSLIMGDAGYLPYSVSAGRGDMEYFIFDANDKEIYGFDDDTDYYSFRECCFLYPAGFYDNCSDIRYFNVTEEENFYLFFDDHADYISSTDLCCYDDKIYRMDELERYLIQKEENMKTTESDEAGLEATEETQINEDPAEISEPEPCETEVTDIQISDVPEETYVFSETADSTNNEEVTE